MNYEFRMTFKLPIIDEMDQYDERLFDSDLTEDTFFGVSETGILEVEFDRQGRSAESVIRKAQSDVTEVLEEAVFIESFPDIVNLTELAECLSMSRQASRKLWEINKDSFPTPLHSGKSLVWNLAPILYWMRSNEHNKYDSKLFDIALTNMQINVDRQLSDVKSICPGLASGSSQKAASIDAAPEIDSNKMVNFSYVGPIVNVTHKELLFHQVTQKQNTPPVMHH